MGRLRRATLEKLAWHSPCWCCVRQNNEIITASHHPATSSLLAQAGFCWQHTCPFIDHTSHWETRTRYTYTPTSINIKSSIIFPHVVMLVARPCFVLCIFLLKLLWHSAATMNHMQHLLLFATSSCAQRGKDVCVNRQLFICCCSGKIEFYMGFGGIYSHREYHQRQIFYKKNNNYVI